MAKLWFQNSNGDEKIIAEVTNFTGVCDAIYDFIDRCNEGKLANERFKSYYMRYWKEGKRIKIDVGSHTEFFYTDLQWKEG